MNFNQLTKAIIIIIGVLCLLAFYASLSYWILLLPIVYYITNLVLGAIYIERNFYIKSQNHLYPDNQNKEICLTFDDGIHAELTPKVLAILKKENIKAVFFLIGKNIKGNESILKRIKDEGHQIGNHSFEHNFWFDMKSSSKMTEDLLHCNETISKVTGQTPILFRPPYGVTNPNLAKAIKDLELKSIGWNVRSMDTVAKSKADLLAKLKTETKANAIILLHDRCKITIDVLTDYIDYCKQQGFTFVTL